MMVLWAQALFVETLANDLLGHSLEPVFEDWRCCCRERTHRPVRVHCPLLLMLLLVLRNNRLLLTCVLLPVRGKSSQPSPSSRSSELLLLPRLEVAGDVL
jgi:hypothetical protein